MAKAINIVLDESKHPNVFFVEIEKDNGKSIAIGKRVYKIDDELTYLRITPVDIAKA